MSQAEETLERLRKQAEETDGEQEVLVEEEAETAEEVGADAQDAEAEGASKKSSTRDYVVLMNAGGGQYKVLGDAVHAGSGEAAILSLGEKVLQGGSEYVAVPKRNWTTATPRVETTTVITLE